MHYSRWKRGGSLDKPEERRGLCLSERFWQYVDVGEWDDCWEWTACRYKQGYGQFVLYDPKQTVLAHRMAWEQFWRQPLQKWALHRCNNRACCNPLHIYDGTPPDNWQDMVEAGTWKLRPDCRKAVGEAAGNAKLTDDAVREIRRRYAEGGISQQKLADEYGVNQSKISDVVNRRTWRHVE